MDLVDRIQQHDSRAIARAISLVEDGDPLADTILSSLDENLLEKAIILGITGPPGAGKSTLTNQLIGSYRKENVRLGIIAIDPSSPISGGAILGDRIRMMGHALDRDVVVRSMATRGRLGGLCAAAGAAARIMAHGGCNVIIIETVGVGQSEMDIIRLADITAMVLAPGLGDDIQAMKAGLLEVSDIFIINKADLPGSDALAMDMEAVAREKHDQENGPRVCTTAAENGTGISELLAVIKEIDYRHRDTGLRHTRRLNSYQLEILDWSIEHLRPRLEKIISKNKNIQKGDPRLQAQKIIATLLKD